MVPAWAQTGLARVRGPSGAEWADLVEGIVVPTLLPAVRRHLASNVTGGREGLVFPAAGDPARHLAPLRSTRCSIGRAPRPADPTSASTTFATQAAVLAASSAATLAELVARLGHSTAGAALRYVHAATNRDKVIAEACQIWPSNTGNQMQPVVSSAWPLMGLFAV
jgi:hypothetical protein